MNTNQYTQKTLEALQAAQQLAVEYQHNALEPEHLLHALASQEQGLIPQLLQKLNVDPGSFAAAVAEKLSALPRVSGSGRDPDKVYISQATDKVLSAAAREAKAMKDEYVSVEHVFLGLLDEPTQNTTELFRAFNIKKDVFLQQLTAVRGNQRVTNDNPEDTYNALQKYGQDLVDLARKQKLDPVIGRDQEIRNVIRILSRKTKNNPCLIGEPGVGKTAIAEGKYIKAEEATRDLTDFMAMFKKFAMNIPPRAVKSIAGYADPQTARAMERAMRKELEDMLAVFVDAAEIGPEEAEL